jgi:hypothetical protein
MSKHKVFGLLLIYPCDDLFGIGAAGRITGKPEVTCASAQLSPRAPFMMRERHEWAPYCRSLERSPKDGTT